MSDICWLCTGHTQSTDKFHGLQVLLCWTNESKERPEILSWKVLGRRARAAPQTFSVWYLKYQAYKLATFSNKKANNTLSSLRVLYWTYRAPRGGDKCSTQPMLWLPNWQQVEGVLVLRPRHHSPSIFGFAECLAKSLTKHSGPRRLEALDDWTSSRPFCFCTLRPVQVPSSFS